MKRQYLAFSIMVVFLLGGCSLLENVNNTVTYVNEATDYVNEVGTFINEVPPLAEKAISDEQALVELETKLEDMKGEMEAFNELQAPEIATDIHQTIINHNEKAEDGIDVYLNNIEDGKLDSAVFENTEIFQSLQEITNTIDQIKQLGQ